MSETPQLKLTDFIAFNAIHSFSSLVQPSYYQLGFMCSVQAVPELIALEDWLFYLWRDGDIRFDDETQAAEYAQHILSLTSTINELYEQAAPLTDLQCEQWLTLNEDGSTPANEFSAGFLAAIEVFNTQWLVVDADPNVQNLLQTSILLLSKLAPPEQVDADTLALFEQLPAASEILTILPTLISQLAYNASQLSAS